MTRYSFNTLNHSVIFGLPPSLPDQIAAAATAGYDHVGVDIGTVLAHEAAGLGPAALADVMHQHGVSCYELVPMMLTSDEHQFEAGLADLLRVVSELRPAIVYAIGQEEPDETMAAHFRVGAQALAGLGIGSAIEYVAGWGVDTLDKALDLAVAAGAGVGLVMDSWQFFRTPGGWPALNALAGDRIAFAQLADGLAQSMADPMFEMSNRRCIPGEGAFDLTGFRDAVRGRGFDGVVSVEVLNDDWRARPVTDFARATLAATRALWDAPA